MLFNVAYSVLDSYSIERNACYVKLFLVILSNVYACQFSSKGWFY